MVMSIPIVMYNGQSAVRGYDFIFRINQIGAIGKPRIGFSFEGVTVIYMRSFLGITKKDYIVIYLYNVACKPNASTYLQKSERAFSFYPNLTCASNKSKIIK